MPVLQAQAIGMIGPTPRLTAMQNMNQRNNLLAGLGSGGGNKRRRKYGGQKTFQVPQVPATNVVPSTLPGGTQGQITGMTSLTLNNDAQAALDKNVTLAPIPKGSTGGKRTRRRGGFVWPCLSGGKSKKSKKSNKSRKSKKSRKTRRH